MNGAIVCRACLMPGAIDTAIDWLTARADDMTSADQAFVARIQGLDLSDLNDADLAVAGLLVERYGDA